MFQNVNQAAVKQTYFILWLAADASHASHLVTYVCPQDKLIRLPPKPCFILDEFLLLLQEKATTSSQASTIYVPRVRLQNKSLRL